MSRHTTYHELVDTFQQGGCPVCSLALRRAKRAMESLLYENVNDIDVRHKLRRSYGFCGEHAAQLFAIHDPLGATILYHDIVATVATRLRELSPQAGNPSRLRKSLLQLARALHRIRRRDKEAACLACEAQAAAEELYLRELLEHIHEADFQERYRSARLCLPHFAAAVELCKDGGAAAHLMETQLAMLEGLEGQLRECIRKADYRHQYEPKGDEAEAWIDAVGTVVGKALSE